MKRGLAWLLTLIMVITVSAFSPMVAISWAEESGTAELLPTADTFVQAVSGDTGANSGGKTTLEIGYESSVPPTQATGFSGGAGALRYRRDVLMQFALGDIAPAAISSAQLYLTIATSKNMSGTQCTATTLAAYATAGDWAENAVTWSSAPQSGALAAISEPIIQSDCAAGKVVAIDLTHYMRQNPQSVYAFRLEAAAAGFDFHSKESGTASARPRLVITYDNALLSSMGGRSALTEARFTDDASPDTICADEGLLTVAVNKTVDSAHGALSSRNAYLKFDLPVTTASHRYDIVRLMIRASSIDNAAQVLSLSPTAASWSGTSLTWNNAPTHGEAVATATAAKDATTPLRYFAFDLTDYVNQNGADTTQYSFAMTANGAISKWYSNASDYAPYVDYRYREAHTVTLRYTDTAGNDLATAETTVLSHGDAFSPSTIPLTIDDYFYSSAETTAQNTFPYTVESDVTLRLIYEKKTISGYEAVAVNTLQNMPPMLPETVLVHFAGGSDERFPVTWSTIDESAYATSGSFPVSGTLQGIAAAPVTAEVTVLGVLGVNLATLTTAPLVPPALPLAVEVSFEQDVVESLTVTWNDIDPSLYEAVGSFTVGGTIDDLGIPVNTTVLVEEGDPDDRAALADTYTMDTEPTTAHNIDSVDGDNILRLSGRTGSPASACANSNRRVFVRFEGGGYDFPEEGALDDIVSASVRLYVKSIANDATPSYSIYGILPEQDDWQEETLTWNTQDGVIENAVYCSTTKVKQSTFTAGWVDFDVTAFVRAHRDAQYLSFYLESDLCAAIVASKDGLDASLTPTLRISKYIPDAPVTVHSVANIGGKNVDLTEPAEMTGKLGKAYTYTAPIPAVIAYPEADPDGVYYYLYETNANPSSDPDPDLTLPSLSESGNTMNIRYVRLDAASAERTAAETYTGKLPTLPEQLTVTLDNGATVTKSVTWQWDDISPLTYGQVGTFTVQGVLAHTDLRAEADITVYNGYLENEASHKDGSFDLEADTLYALQFTAQNLAELPDEALAITINTDQGSTPAFNLEPNELRAYIESFGDGAEVTLYFTTGSGNSMTLELPECAQYLTHPTLSEVTQRGADLQLIYMADGAEIARRSINAPFGASFTLNESDFFPNAAYTVSAIDAANSDIAALTDTLTLDGINQRITLLCSYNETFTATHALENAKGLGGETVVKATASTFNGTSAEQTSTLLLAVFDEDGRLRAVESAPQTLAPNSPQHDVTLSVTLAEGEHAASMLWDGVATLIPLQNKIDSRNPGGTISAPETDDMILIPASDSSLTVSTQQSGNEGVNMLTRDLSTRWSAQVVGDAPVSAVINLGDLYEIHTIGLAFYKGDSRRSSFSVQVSEDGETFRDVIARRASGGKTDATEYYTFPAERARYVRLYGYGWTAMEVTGDGLHEVSGDWFSVTSLETYGTLASDADHTEWESETFDGLIGALDGSGWNATALNEETYTDYTPALGDALYADFAASPIGTEALHLYDNVGRYPNDPSLGAGSVGASHSFSAPSGNYHIRFDWYVPNTIDGATYNADWAGVTLSSGALSGGADTAHPTALQLRLAPSGKNRMSFKILRSIQYNEGSTVNCLGATTAFRANTKWDVDLAVRPEQQMVAVTISDGTRTETQYVNYGLYDLEKTRSETWLNNLVNHITFNTGSGGKCEMFVDNFRIYTDGSSFDGDNAQTIYTQDFSDAPKNWQIFPDDTGDDLYCDTQSALIQEGASQSYNPFFGSLLFAQFTDLPSAAGLGINNRALQLYDFVGRETSGSKGAGGVFTYVDIPALDTNNVYKVKFKMYAPTYGEYAGFALAHGHNSGGDDRDHPIALQARFSPQSSGMQFNYYPSIHYNKGSSTALVGTGSNRMSYGAVWDFDLTVNPNLQTIQVRVTDGSKVSSRTISFATNGEDSRTENWSTNKIDTLIFNTGAGTSAEIYVDDIEVIDTGMQKNSLAAIGGIMRLESTYSGQGYFMINPNASWGTPWIASGSNPYYTRFVERRGLADPDSVSIEIMSMPGYYLAASSDGWSIRVEPYNDSADFRRRATFNKLSSLSGEGSTAFSYQLYNFPNRYLRNNNNSLKPSSADDTNTKKACSWHLRNEVNHYVSDAFKGNKISSQWYKGYPWYSNYHNHSAVARAENIVVEDGNVLLKATPVASNDWIKNSAGATGYSDSINNNKWKKYCAYTGVISINSKVFNKGSYIEGSFKQPNSPRGYWTAFWLNGRDSWPPETDMFEYLSSKGTSTWYTATHGGNEGAGWQYSSAVGNLRTQFHTFAIDWGYNYMKMYVNGSLYFTAPDTSYQKNMYLILNTGIGAWESEPDSSTVWNTGLELQWIRGFQYY